VLSQNNMLPGCLCAHTLAIVPVLDVSAAALGVLNITAAVVGGRAVGFLSKCRQGGLCACACRPPKHTHCAEGCLLFMWLRRAASDMGRHVSERHSNKISALSCMGYVSLSLVEKGNTAVFYFAMKSFLSSLDCMCIVGSWRRCRAACVIDFWLYGVSMLGRGL